MISSDFDGEKIIYALVLLTFNDFLKDNFTVLMIGKD